MRGFGSIGKFGGERVSVLSMSRAKTWMLAVALAATTAAWPSRAKDLAWQAVPGGRWTALEVPAQGHTGFTLLPADQTGIAFTNSIDEQAAAANRVLYNG